MGKMIYVHVSAVIKYMSLACEDWKSMETGLQ